MLVLTLTENGFSSNMDITEQTFSSPTSNTLVKVVCKPPLKILQPKLINNVCDYLNSFVDFKILTHHVVYESSTIADTEIDRISELTFQIYW